MNKSIFYIFCTALSFSTNYMHGMEKNSIQQFQEALINKNQTNHSYYLEMLDLNKKIEEQKEFDNEYISNIDTRKKYIFEMTQEEYLNWFKINRNFHILLNVQSSELKNYMYKKHKVKIDDYISKHYIHFATHYINQSDKCENFSLNDKERAFISKAPKMLHFTVELATDMYYIAREIVSIKSI